MTIRRKSSRRVALTATFLALAAGGTAACDTPQQDDGTFYTGPGDVYEAHTDGGLVEEVTEEEPDEDEDDEEIFYCADEDGEIVEEENCDDDTSAGGLFFLWHSSSYARGLGPGERLDPYDGNYFSPGDKASRKAFKLPATGRVTNGTIKTNVVGRGITGGDTSGG